MPALCRTRFNGCEIAIHYPESVLLNLDNEKRVETAEGHGLWLWETRGRNGKTITGQAHSKAAALDAAQSAAV